MIFHGFFPDLTSVGSGFYFTHMASANKKKKLKNSYCCGGALKEKDFRIKRLLFYTSAKRLADKRSVQKEISEY